MTDAPMEGFVLQKMEYREPLLRITLEVADPIADAFDATGRNHPTVKEFVRFCNEARRHWFRED